jgi:peptide/nickel transport system substrate-binding protein
VQAETPPGVLVVAQSLDDAVSFDPAEGVDLKASHGRPSCSQP